MESIIISLSILISFQCFSQTPREVVQLQLDAYNKGDIEAFLEVFTEDAEAYNYGDTEPFIKGKANFKTTYRKLFQSSPNLDSLVASRQVLGQTVIDYEYITGRSNSGKPVLIIAIYKIENHKIIRCDFIRE
ncbi:nuclear transport factor 2 family protein [Psychroflexus sp. MES1-P1E]|uniref:nuclear transport factor 2 family protein n=1 Tax=Psychroflexus sp. MES1-P1E TaxID=2058320 RepID=UPI000C7C246F|nr:nuclear transport factor 2 family protein [Psychroflexus sp. MES1-P1E]PKG42920.1 hypothetical protein CXF67_07745 [Psychroflexus sp. MES1-P1E]